jgi:hypothetical protein
MKNSNDTIGNQSRDLPVCRAVLQPLRHCVPPNRNEYQEYFLGGKGGRCLGLTNHLHLPTVMKNGSLYLLELSGPVQTSAGIPLPLPYLL